MKKKIWAMVLSMVMIIVALPTVAIADTQEYDDTGDYRTASEEATQNGNMDNEFEIPVGVIIDGAQITYCVTVSFGAMQFKYSYGGTWNPATHSYTGNQPGWDDDDLTAENTELYVKNDSNYPTKITYEYINNTTQSSNTIVLNASQTSTSVVGYFADDIPTMKAQHSTSISNTQTIPQTKVFTLPMNTTNLSPGNIYYDTPASAGNTTEKTMYFSLLGDPDNGLTSNVQAREAGTIKVTIEPAPSAVRHTY